MYLSTIDPPVNSRYVPHQPCEQEFSELPPLQPFRSLGAGINDPLILAIWRHLFSPEGINKANSLGAAVMKLKEHQEANNQLLDALEPILGVERHNFTT